MKKIESTTHSYTRMRSYILPRAYGQINSDIDVLYIDRLKITVILSGIVEMMRHLEENNMNSLHRK